MKLYHKNFKRLWENEIFISDQKIKHEYVNQLNLIEIYPSTQTKCVIRSYTNPN